MADPINVLKLLASTITFVLDEPYLLAVVTNSVMSSVAARLEQSICEWIQRCIFDSRCKCMLRVMTMLQCNMARNTEIVVLANSASYKVILGEF